MRKIKYLSPTSLMKWQYNTEDFYLQYLADNRPPRIPQTQPMAVGAAFDAYIKSFFHERLFGVGNDPKFQFEAIFESQVEPHNRDWAREAGKYVFDCYKISGSMADLLSELQEGSEPRFEFTITEEIRGVTLLGKPDVFYVHKLGTPIILDFKVNGFCSTSAKSPNRGYLRVRDGWKDAPPSRNANAIHKDAQAVRINGVLLNIAEYLETINKEWALQLSTYGWLCGAEVGSEFVCALDQIVAKPTGGQWPQLRVAEHRCLISKSHQYKTMAQYSELWEIVHSNHIFRDRTLEESDARCKVLDQQYRAFEDEASDFMKRMTGRV